jgi:hypothetical protein
MAAAPGWGPVGPGFEQVEYKVFDSFTVRRDCSTPTATGQIEQLAAGTVLFDVPVFKGKTGRIE